MPAHPALDDRARPAPALDPREVRAAAEGPDPQRAALARHLTNAIKVESRRWTWRGWGIGLVLVTCWVGLLVFVHTTGMRRYTGVSSVSFWGGLVVVILLSRADTRRRVATQLAATAVAEGLCGSCCYSLRDIPREPDGCLVCPECGAAWQARRITRPHWAGAGTPRARAEGGRAGTGANWFVRFVTLTPPPSALLTPDDRGRFVGIPDSRLLLLPRSRRADLGPARIRETHWTLRRVGMIPRVLVGLIPLIFSGGIAIAAADRYRNHETSDARLLLIPFAIFFSLGVGIILSHSFYSTRRAARVMVSRGLCASCARPLGGLTPDPDGCTVCPECGASWRTDVPEPPAPAGPAGPSAGA